MNFKKFLLYFLLSFILSTSNGFSKVEITFFKESYNAYLNNNTTKRYQLRNDKLPDIINEDKIYSKKTFNYKGTLNITENGSLRFIDNSTLIIKDSTINNKGKNPIVFDKSNLTASKTTINSEILLSNTVLTYTNGYIKHLTIQGTSKIALKDTKFDTLQFEKLGSTDDKVGAGFNNITANNVKININDINNEDDIKNKVKRKYNIKNVDIEYLDIKGYINIDSPKEKISDSLEIPLYDFYDSKNSLNTNFSFDEGTIKKITYIDPSVKKLIQLPRNETGVFNFKNLTIDELQVSYNLLRNLSFNGATVKYFELQDINLQKDIHNNLKDDDNNSNKPEIPKYNNLQLMGTGISYFETFNLNNAKELKIESEISKVAYNAPLGSLYIKNLENYKDTQFSLYNIKEINFGIERAPIPPKVEPDKKGSLGNIPPMPQVPYPGGTNPTININYLHRVTTLGIYNNTAKLHWKLHKNPTTQKEQYLSIYNLSNLNLQNSLLDVTETHNIKPHMPQGTTYDPRKDYAVYDFYFTYDDQISSFGTIFYFDHSGAVKNGNQYDQEKGRPKENYVPLRIKVKGNAFTVANNMLSNLTMELNGERNLFTLENNQYNKDYHFHTNYNYDYLNPKEGKHKPNSSAMKYNYWSVNENERVEQNWYTFKCDMVIVDKNSADYKKYKEQHAGGKDYATTWFTYWQPYRVDENGNPSKTPPKNTPGKDSSDDEYKYGDQKAWDQKTDGSGRGGFPCEFGNKIQVENAKVTMLKPLDNLTVLEVVDKGVVDFSHMDPKYLEPKSDAGKNKRPQWITLLRMRGGELTLAQRPLTVDKLQVYTEQSYNYATFRPIFGQNIIGKKASDVLDTQKLIVNKLADFNHNYLKVDLYFDSYFIDLNTKITLNILDLGEYKEKVKDEQGKDKEKEVIKKGEIKNLEGIIFDQGILFSTNHYWKDNKLYLEITRTKNFSHFINNIDKPISDLLDKIINKYSVNVDKEGKFQFLGDNIDLNNDTKILINTLFKAKSKEALEDNFASLRPINNETIFLTTSMSTEKLLESIKNSNNYTYESNKGKLTFWSTSSIGNSVINNKGDILGTTINNQTLVAGSSSKINKFKIGAFVGYSHNNLTSAYINGEADQYGGGVYTDISLGKGYFIKVSGIASSIQFKGNREHYFMNTNTNFKFNVMNTVGNLNFGKTFIMKGGFITSYVSTNIGYLKFNDYKEAGSSPAAIEVKGIGLPYYFSSVGIEYANQIDILVANYNASIVPKIGISYKYRWHNIPDTQVQFYKLNSKDIITYTSNNYNKYNLVVNTGVNYLLNYHFSITSNFNAEVINKDFTNYSLYIGCKYSF